MSIERENQLRERLRIIAAARDNHLEKYMLALFKSNSHAMNIRHRLMMDCVRLIKEYESDIALLISERLHT